jgi:hypothetical protein
MGLDFPQSKVIAVGVSAASKMMRPTVAVTLRPLIGSDCLPLDP